MTYEKELEKRIEQLEEALEVSNKEIKNYEKFFSGIKDFHQVDLEKLIIVNWSSSFSIIGLNGEYKEHQVTLRQYNE